MKKYCFGIDIGGTSVKCGLFDVKGNVLEKWEIKTKVENNGVQIIPDVAKTIEEKIQDRGLDREEIAGVGIGVPGPVNEAGEVNCAVNLHWGHVKLVEEIQKLTGLRAMAGNDANVAALGEMWKGGGAGHKNVVMVTLGTGVGGGIIVNGRIVTGSHGAGGEIGHVHVTDEVERECNCGNWGCLEQVASATGIVYLAKRHLAASDKPSALRSGEVSAKAVFDAVKDGDELAIEVAEQFGKYLGTALSVIAGVVDPEVFVIGGGVSKAGPILFDYIGKYYKKYAFSACEDAEFALAILGNDAGIYGAARMVLPEEQA
ncbi:MAG: ROK family glucokinase [Lachnospiraceae bacterium]|jgi:glucokinase|nr:ROK family glucokinase [Lachnospiraceae bacterium]